MRSSTNAEVIAMATRRKRTRHTASRANGRSARKRRSGTRAGTRKWSGRVTRESNALDLDAGVFTLASPKRIAASLKRSAQRSRRRKADAFRSALSMLTFYINRAGRNLSASRKRTLNKAKDELRVEFGRG
jgi:Protein of unknown function (DUF3175)